MVNSPLTIAEVASIVNHLGSPYDIEFDVDTNYEYNPDIFKYAISIVSKVPRKFLFFKWEQIKLTKTTVCASLTDIIRQAELIISERKRLIEEADRIRSKYPDITFENILRNTE